MADYSLMAAYCSFKAVYYSLMAGYYSLKAVYYSLKAVYRWLMAVYGLFSVRVRNRRCDSRDSSEYVRQRV